MDPVEGNLHHMRENYGEGNLDMDSIFPSPFMQFEVWYQDASNANIAEPNAMVLSTATKDGRPSSRVVLLKEYNNKGFIFFTNYESRKGIEIAENPYACLNFWWPPLERQVRIEGVLEKIPAADSDAYFYSRPKGSQAGAIASPQSKVIESRAWLEQTFIRIQLEQEIKRPDHWGGYILRAERIEFWQGRTNRLHDRLLYSIQDDASWTVVRLAP
ncbi:MAG: pyridoxamine 5'-phosphate oxidase [Chitinophagales bacterium]